MQGLGAVPGGDLRGFLGEEAPGARQGAAAILACRGCGVVSLRLLGAEKPSGSKRISYAEKIPSWAGNLPLQAIFGNDSRGHC